MRLVIVECHYCHKEISRTLLEENNLKEYQTDKTFQTCKNCKDSPGSRLLDAIFGVSDNEERTN